jgi:hypothetical protein
MEQITFSRRDFGASTLALNACNASLSELVNPKCGRKA